jgi:hypothetical protein
MRSRLKMILDIEGKAEVDLRTCFLGKVFMSYNIVEAESMYIPLISNSLKYLTHQSMRLLNTTAFIITDRISPHEVR